MKATKKGHSMSGSTEVDILKSIKDTELEVKVVLMQRECEIGDLTKLNPGSVLMFDSKEGTPATATVNGKSFAEGEVVQVGERYGLKVTQLLD